MGNASQKNCEKGQHLWRTTENEKRVDPGKGKKSTGRKKKERQTKKLQNPSWLEGAGVQESALAIEVEGRESAREGRRSQSKERCKSSNVQEVRQETPAKVARRDHSH